jgi:hypothetical protein
VSVAKALLVRERLAEEKSKDMVALKTAMVAITTNISALANISKWGKTVKRSGEKIEKKAGALLKRLKRNLSVLENFLVLPDNGEEVVETTTSGQSS